MLLSLVPILAGLLVPSLTSLPSNAQEDLLTDFTEPKVKKQWITVNDTVMGGRSEGGPQFSNGQLKFAGKTNTNGGGFSSIRTLPREWPIGESAGLIIRARGDGRVYEADIILEQADPRAIPIAYRAKFKSTEEWTEHRIPFSAFKPTIFGEVIRGENAKPLDRTKIRTLGFYIFDKKDGPFELNVDSIRTFRTSRDQPSDFVSADLNTALRRGFLAGRLGCKNPGDTVFSTLARTPGGRIGFDYARKPISKIIGYGLEDFSELAFLHRFDPEAAAAKVEQLKELVFSPNTTDPLIKRAMDAKGRFSVADAFTKGLADESISRAMALATWVRVDNEDPRVIRTVVAGIQSGELADFPAVRKFVKQSVRIDIGGKLTGGDSARLIQNFER